MSSNYHLWRRPDRSLHLVLELLVVVLVIATQSQANASSPGSSSAQKLFISSQGINVPKRPTIIAGLNQQFNRGSSASPHKAVGGLLAAVGLPSKPLSLIAAAATGSSSNNRHKQQANATANSASNLYLDRHQQELLAANPTIPITSSNLLTRSDGPPAVAETSSLMDHEHTNNNNLNTNQQRQQATAAAAAAAATNINNQQTDGMLNQLQQQQQQQSYRGYSVIELEVKSELDRRYVQDLYGNLSAALNEQAQRPNSFAVSPYVDIDFWSFKCAVNDHIDIMVSPKSRAFILNQLSRAKIKHRIKIDDIQTKLDQQQQQSPQPISSLGGQQSGNNLAELSGRQSASGAGSSSSGNNQLSSDQQLNGRQQPQQPKLDPFAGTASMNDSLFFENYQRLADINQYLESIVARARDIARVQVIGRSSQGRYLRLLRLGYEQSDLDGSTGPLMNGRSDAATAAAESGPKGADSADESIEAPSGAAQLEAKQQQPSQLNASTILEHFFRRQQSVKKLGSVWLDGGTHAREWISPATVLYLSFRLADNHAKCLRFFDYLHMVVGQQQQQQKQQQQQRAARSSAPNQAQLDSDLINGINEINTSLLSGQQGYAKPRPRSELEQKLELLAKRPQEVASEHACDLELEQLLRRYTFYVMPVLNPDGYEYSHTHNRLWRKTRSTSNHPIYRHFCLGADPNRNYDARHGSAGSSSHPCSQTYGGTTPFTEPETRHQSNFVYAHRDTLKMFISFHSYSQMILLPFSHSKQLAPDHKDLESVGQAGVKAIERTHGTQYRVGPSASILYTASGTASDWAYEKAGIKYSYTIELRDTGTFGFLLPRQQIIPTGEETFNGLLAMIGQMETNDNLLMSKSSLVSSSLAGTNTTASASDSSSTAGFVHAPDLDQLRPFGRFRPKPAQLENALDGSDTWATPEPRSPGVRDRTPVSSHSKFNDGFDSSSSNKVIEDEVVSMSEEEPDAGLAFEGEGELMEPTDNLSVNSALNGQVLDEAAQSAAKLMDQIHAHSSSNNLGELQEVTELIGRNSKANSMIRQRFTNNQLGLSANGRSLINSPPAPSRTTPSIPRRESSNEFSS